MPLILKSVLTTALILLSFQVHAELPNFSASQPYQEVKAELIKQGWQPVRNLNIDNSSLYAQDLYLQGLKEVVDCISMELDACWLKYKKGKQTLVVKTITRELKFDSIELDK